MFEYKIIKGDSPTELEEALNLASKEGFRAISFSTINHPGSSTVWFMAIMECEVQKHTRRSSYSGGGNYFHG
jgi:hypothetical protein